MTTPKELVMAALSKQKTERTPIGIFTQSATVDQMDAVGAQWPDAHSNADLMAKLAAAAATTLSFDTIRIPFDLTAEAEAFGATVDLGKQDRTPMLKAHPYESGSDPVIPTDLSKGRVGVVIEATKKLKAQYGNEYPIVVGVAGPFTLAGHLVETGNLLLWCITEPDSVHKFVEAATKFEEKYIAALVAAGADVIVFVDPSASTDMMHPDMFDVFALPYLQRCNAAAKGAKTVLHICGNTTELLDHMIKTGVDGVSIEEKVTPESAVSIVNGRVALVGNVGVVKPLFQGNAADTTEATKRVVAAGFNIVAPGCGLAAKVPKENLVAMVKAVKG
ncbi:MtaA/CmuA family methyltransferase [Methanomassiliicoccus luminyensis]|uniref:MtaA/CmuA family methyltransferase n=1 Tax=Methanomassiliicoccus luminyensis TaxID=1080712 RepID=UPI00138AD230|nr:MtaA/CmuA family methyltransferase [Methanomassiliicoccus luminyensis]